MNKEKALLDALASTRTKLQPHKCNRGHVFLYTDPSHRHNLFVEIDFQQGRKGTGVAVRVALHSAHPVVFAGLQTAISEYAPDFLCLLPCAPVLEAEQWINELQVQNPDILLVDVQNFVPYGLVAGLREAMPRLAVVLWVNRVYTQMAKHAIDLGVRGVLTKECDLALVVRCLARVAAGELWFERKLTDQLLVQAAIHLSQREVQLLTLVTQGLSNKEIAHALELTEGTVKQYFTRLFRKCGVNDRLELVFYGMRNLFGEAPHEGGEPWATRMANRKCASS